MYAFISSLFCYYPYNIFDNKFGFIGRIFYYLIKNTIFYFFRQKIKKVSHAVKYFYYLCSRKINKKGVLHCRLRLYPRT